MPPDSPESRTASPAGEGLVARLFGGPEIFAGAPATRAIIWANVFVFVACLASSRSGAGLIAMPEETMIAFGANVASSTLFDHRIETLVTCCFLHFSLLHIGFNMYALRQVGPFVERSVGSGRFAMMYVLSGITGSIGSALWWYVHRGSVGVSVSAGASGAICGVIGAAMIIGARTQGWRGTIAQGMARWLGTIFILGVVARFDNAAHAGGALGGAIIASLWRRGEAYSETGRRVALVAAAVVCVGAGIAVAGRDLTDPYATLISPDERYNRAVEALSALRCDDARRGVEATARLTPTALRVETLRGAIARHCSEAAPRER